MVANTRRPRVLNRDIRRDPARDYRNTRKAGSSGEEIWPVHTIPSLVFEGPRDPESAISNYERCPTCPAGCSTRYKREKKQHREEGERRCPSRDTYIGTRTPLSPDQRWAAVLKTTWRRTTTLLGTRVRQRVGRGGGTTLSGTLPYAPAGARKAFSFLKTKWIWVEDGEGIAG